MKAFFEGFPKILKEENIRLLGEMIPNGGVIVEGCQDYLFRLKELYAMCVRYVLFLFLAMKKN